MAASENLHVALAIVARLAASEGIAPDWIQRLSKLKAELEPADGKRPSDETHSIDTKEGIYRAIKATEQGHSYLILLPPDPPPLEVCDQCKGKRVKGSAEK